MTTQDILAIILLIAAAVIIIAVLLQSSKGKGLSGTIAGSSETYFGRNKGKSLDKKLSMVTTILAVLFLCVVLFVYVMQTSVLDSIFDMYNVTLS